MISAIKTRAAELERTIDEDHFGAGFGFRFGKPDEPIIQRYNELLSKRLGKEPSGFTAVGDASAMMALVHEFRDAGVHKFILRPIASGTDEMLAQTRLMIERLLPEPGACDVEKATVGEELVAAIEGEDVARHLGVVVAAVGAGAGQAVLLVHEQHAADGAAGAALRCGRLKAC